MAAQEEDRDGFKFRSGRLALDLPASLAGRLRQPRELLETPEDLGRWLIASGLTPVDPSPGRATLEQARQLREALYRLGMACVRQQPLEPGDMELVNHFAARSPPVPQLTPAGVRWEGTSAPALLSAIARDAVDLFGTPLAGFIRKCGNESCALMFLDQSRSKHRRWCSMAGCGNKAKVAEFRRRQADETPERSK
ncbi:CGNR zinc finger domain-containing protein [Hyalangium versicolor]|uniref:CGNR zinc finger domain-containing protein n=1 Tax=Hyalangium versicolor TaxID=2861190 RepID=UPI001CCE2DAB|nr:CGNR zinc finger domain-containing protein [Hyalangium versicolor]